MNSWGNRFRVTLWGESHGAQVGVTIDGVPAGIALAESDFEADLARRRAGAAGTTPRKESDAPHIVSGIYRGFTTGAPLTVEFLNTFGRLRIARIASAPVACRLGRNEEIPRI